MFTILSPQRVQHTTGYIVQTGDRHSMQYLDGEILAEIGADFALITGLYPDSMTITPKGLALSRPPTPAEREVVMNRIKAGLVFLGEKFEICQGKP